MPTNERWIEVTPSQFAHEAEGLRRIRELIPTMAPFRAWSNFEFRDDQGKWHEIDLLVLGRRRIHLVELKHYAGTLSGDDHRWLRDGRHAEDSPLKLTRRKAQRLASRLRGEMFALARANGTRLGDIDDHVPYIQECVYLHHSDLRCTLAPAARVDLYGLDDPDSQAKSGLEGISARLLESPTPYQEVTQRQEADTVELMARIAGLRHRRTVGSWVLDPSPVAEGRGWQDWRATHRVADKERARIRFHVVPPGAAAPERERLRKVAAHEYRLMHRLSHDHLLRPIELVDDELGTGLVYPDDDTHQRLDLWLAEQGRQISSAEQLAIVRQVAEALAYAHANGVVHRGLTPAAVRLHRRATGELAILVGDWQASGRFAAAGAQPKPSSDGVTDLASAEEARERGIERNDGITDPDRRLAGAFQAPEGAWNPAGAERVRVDVFALGALAYLVIAGRPPATDRQSLRDRIVKDAGLDLAADLPQVPAPLRAAVLKATRPEVSQRSASVRAFLADLADAERALGTTEEPDVDALEALPGAILEGRWRLEERLGSGSTAVGLKVTDLAAGSEGMDAVRVLKVALDDAAGLRLESEAEVLRALTGPRFVRLVDGPIDLGDRRALVLESAGDETLADQLRLRRRLSLDRLDSWGTELLEAVVALERAGVHHRDLKPSNLGILEGRGDRRKHLVLFDFSLSRAGQSAIHAGTPPYLDPFIGEKGRVFDSAAERYSAAVVLFEMATGSTPAFGDGLSDPAAQALEAGVEESMFDTTAAPALVPFFRKGLARDHRVRFDTAADMLVRWREIFQPLLRAAPNDAAALVAAADLTTRLPEAGMSARALSAVESLHVVTVADLVAVDPVALSGLKGVDEATRRELRAVAKAWRERFAGELIVTDTADLDATPAPFPTPDLAAALLVASAAGEAGAKGRRNVLGLILGADAAVGAFAGQADLASKLAVSRARVAQLLAGTLRAWSGVPDCRKLLASLLRVAMEAIDDLGGLATVDEIAAGLLAAAGGAMERDTDLRTAAGLLRLTLDHSAAHARAGDREPPIATRRRDGRMAVLALTPGLLDGAEALGRVADELVRGLGSTEAVVAATRAEAALSEAFDRGAGGLSASVEPRRLLRLAAALSADAAVSGRDELHRRDLDATAAVSLALRGLGGDGARIGEQEVRDRVRARFPALAPLPERPRLDHLVEAADLGLRWDAELKRYRSVTPEAGTHELLTRRSTSIPTVTGVDGHVAERLRDSLARRSFLAIGVDATDLDAVSDRLAAAYGASVLDLTGAVLASLRDEADQAGVPWPAVLAADSATEGSQAARGLVALLDRSWPGVEAAIEARMGADGDGPVVLGEPGPLARYGRLSMLSRWTDLAAARRRALWLLVPQVAGNQGPVVDGKPVPLAAPGQFLRLPSAGLPETARPVEAVTS